MIFLLYSIVQVLIENYSESPDTIVVLPNKRVLLISLEKTVYGNILSPEIISIEDFIQDRRNSYCGSIELLLNFMMYTCQLLKKQTSNHLNCLPITKNTLAGF
jgi:hypothetical protein